MQRKVSNGISTTTAIQTATSSQPFDLTHRHGERRVYELHAPFCFWWHSLPRPLSAPQAILGQYSE
ncbi:MAG TPA: hypothetical protein VKV29_01925 [Chthonomonas sp.]|uniref:hypothetical protein n=1 Tax=Chthonomonas sp. TaxID=2282153 RepID=UPI002B4B590B|nr:hypothetical protein [Chthonomonas sp.]HLH79022.1 hypothetical protein [Chthonomonas sp.]